MGQASVGSGPNSRSCCSHSQVTKPTQILAKEEESLGRRYHCGQPKERLQGNLAVWAIQTHRENPSSPKGTELRLQEACWQLHKDRDLDVS